MDAWRVARLRAIGVDDEDDGGNDDDGNEDGGDWDDEDGDDGN